MPPAAVSPTSKPSPPDPRPSGGKQPTAKPTHDAPAHAPERRQSTPDTDPAGRAGTDGAAAGAAAPRDGHQGHPRAGRDAPNLIRDAARNVGAALERAGRIAFDPETTTLKRIARQTREGREWHQRTPLSEGRNAHYSNTAEEMRDALEGDHDWIEGDLRLDDDGKPVMSHDEGDEGSGLDLDQWLEIGRAGRRGLKVDVKENEALPQLFDAVEASGVKQGRMMFNVADLDADEVQAMRERFPKAWLALNPSTNDDDHYDSGSIAGAIEGAKAAGGRVAFPIRWDIADDATIQALRAYGKVSIWNSADHGIPDDPEAETTAIKARGANGVIDLGEP